MQRTVTKRLDENVVNENQNKVVASNVKTSTVALTDRNKAYQTQATVATPVENVKTSTVTLADRNRVYQTQTSVPRPQAPNATMTLAQREQYANMSSMPRRSVTNSRNELDFTKPFVTDKHRYFALKQINSLSGEANLLIAKDETDKIVLIKLYKMQLNEDERRPLLKFLMNLPAGSNIMPVLDTGYFNKLPFEIIPYYKDGDITNMGPISIDMLSKVVLPQINEALHYMHHKGFIHRDIKPENIYLIKSTNKIVIGDFGITSTLSNGASLKATVAGRGTEGYVAPEVAQHNVTFATDYYSLGITICSLLLGRNVFEHDDASRIFLKVNNQSFCNFITHENLRRLVCGLTLQDIKFRFGYQDVLDYCSSKPLRNVLNFSSPAMNNFKRPYTFEGKPCRNINELGTAMLRNWPRALEHVKRGVLESFFSHVDESLCLRIKEYVEQESDLDIVLAKILVHFGLPTLINFKDVSFKDVISFADKQAESFPKIQDNLMKIIESGIIKTAQEFVCQVSQTKKNLELLDFINSAYECKDVELRYFLICMNVSSKELDIEIDNKKIKNIGDFVNIFKNDNEAPRTFRRLIDIQIVQALLLSNLDSEKVSRLINEKRRLDDESLYFKFLEILSSKMSIDGLYRVGYEEWLLKNVDEYKFNKKSLELKNRMLEAQKKHYDDNDEIFKYINLRKELVKEFIDKFDNDIYMVNEGKTINSSNLEYYPVINYMNNKVTYKYLSDIKHPNLESYKKAIYQDSSKETISIIDKTKEELHDIYKIYQEDYQIKATSCDRLGTINYIKYTLLTVILAIGLTIASSFIGNVLDEMRVKMISYCVILVIGFVVLGLSGFVKVSRLKKYKKIVDANLQIRNNLTSKASEISKEMNLANTNANLRKSKVKIDQSEFIYIKEKQEKELLAIQKKKIDRRKLTIFCEFIYMILSSAALSYIIIGLLGYQNLIPLYSNGSAIVFGLIYSKSVLKRRNVKVSQAIVNLILVIVSVLVLVSVM